MICYLYRVTRRETGDSYVGISINPKKRWGEHKRDALVRPQGRFHRALRKYGGDAFDWQVVREMTSTRAAKLAEMCLIYVDNPAYNLTAGGDGAWGYKPTRESIEAGASKRRGRPNPRTLVMNAGKRGIKQSPQHVAKRVAKITGKKRPADAVQKTSLANRRSHSVERRTHNRAAQLAFQASLTATERAARTLKARQALAATRAAQK